MTLVLVSFVIIFSGFQLASCRISCRDQNDRAVDWFLIYKLPDINKHWDSAVQKGMGFLYLDENSKEFYLSKVNINSSSQSLAYTLQQLYDTKSQEDVYHVMYNDDHPGSKKDSYRGHTKGVQLFDMDTGYWLIHSVPEFPLQTKYSYPTSGTVYGQSFICITFNRFQLREIAEQLALYQPSIYSSQLPDRLAELYPKLSEIIAKKSIRKPPFNRRSEIMSRGGTLFTSFAKHKKWNLDLYADFVAPSLEQTFYVETWLNGQGDLPSRCNSSYKVYNLRSVIPFGVDFPNSKDHSKWAVAHDQDSPWICIGDINRQSSQYNRAGGTMCLKDKSVWLNYRQAAQKAESCTHFQVPKPTTSNALLHSVYKPVVLICLIIFIFVS